MKFLNNDVEDLFIKFTIPYVFLRVRDFEIDFNIINLLVGRPEILLVVSIFSLILFACILALFKKYL